MRESKAVTIGFWTTLIIFFVGLSWLALYKFNECRDFGHSFLYCIIK